jgi:hypothetical protein
MISRKNLSKILGVIHNIIISLPFLYFFIYLLNDRRYDIYFVLFLLIIRSHWNLLKGECIFTYLEKKILNPNYKLGSDIFCVPTNYLNGTNYIDKKIKPYSLENFNDIKHNLFIFFILLRNIKSKNFNLLLVLSLITIIIQMCWNRVMHKYYSKLRKKYKDIKIKKIPISRKKLY